MSDQAPKPIFRVYNEQQINNEAVVDDEQIAGQKRRLSRSTLQEPITTNLADKGKPKRRDAKKGSGPQIAIKDTDPFACGM